MESYIAIDNVCAWPNLTPMPFWDIVALADGSLEASLYSWPPVRGDSTAHFYQSRDDGRTWEPRSVIQRGDTNETALLNVDGNRLLAAVRTSQARDVELFESDDAGGTWSEQVRSRRKINTPPTCCRWQTGAS